MYSNYLKTLRKAIETSIQSINRESMYLDLVHAIDNHEILGRHPLNIQIQSVSACNASCHFCPYQESWHKQHPGKMNNELYKKVIDEISYFQIEKFCPYLENEPLLDPHLLDHIEYALYRLNPKLVEVSTNASLLNGRKIDDIARLLSRTKHEIRISFHGVDEESFQSVMGLDFDLCRENILALVDKSQDTDLKIIIQGAGQAKVKRKRFPTWFGRKSYFSFWKNEFKKQGFKKLPDIRFFTYHDRAGQIRRNEINIAETVRRDLQGFYCPRIDQWAHFLYNGELILCCMDYRRDTSFGDINNNSLEEIYGSKTFKTLARKATGQLIASDDFICKRCVSPGG